MEQDNKIQLSQTSKPQTKFEISSLLDLVGSSSKYQRYVFIVFCIISFGLAFQNYMYPFLFFEPKSYICFNQSTPEFKCSEEVACSGKFKFKDPSQKFSLIQKFGLYCEKQSLRVQAASLFIGFGFIPILLMGALSGKYGRKFFIQICMLIISLGCFASIFLDSYFPTVICITLMTGFSETLYTLQVLYINEVIGQNLRSQVQGVSDIFYGVGGIFLFYFSNQIWHYKYLLLIIFVFIFVTFIFSFKFVESPFILYKNNKMIDLYQTLTQINHQNNSDTKSLENENQEKLKQLFQEFDLNLGTKKKDQESQITEINQQEKLNQQSKQKNRGQINLIFSIAIIISSLSFTYGMTLIIPNEMGIDMDKAGIFLIMLEIIGTGLAGYFGAQIKRKGLNLVCLGSLIIISFVLVITSPLFLEQNNFIIGIQVFLCLLGKLFLSANMALIYVYLSELINTENRGLAVGISCCLEKISQSFLVVLKDTSKRLKIHPFSSVLFICLISFPVAMSLPETKDKKIST